MRGRRRITVNEIAAWVLSAVLIVLAAPGLAGAGEVYLTLPGGIFTPHVKSMREMRFKTVVVQHYDYSCGAAAVATLLTYSYDRPTTEAEPFLKMFRHGDKAKITRLGFSLLDMKDYLESLGYQVSGFRLTLAQLQHIAVPGIALVQVNGYKHFVVIRAVNDTSVLFADPARGMQILSRHRFDKIWDGVLLVIRNHLELARAGFNEQAFLAARPRAPIATPMHQPVLELSVYTQQLFLRNLF